jgi:hypothetical protein
MRGMWLSAILENPTEWEYVGTCAFESAPVRTAGTDDTSRPEQQLAAGIDDTQPAARGGCS